MQARETILLNNAVHRALGITIPQYVHGGRLSFSDEAKYFQKAEARLWEYIDRARKDGIQDVISTKRIADDIGVSEMFVTNILEEAGMLEDEAEG